MFDAQNVQKQIESNFIFKDFESKNIWTLCQENLFFQQFSEITYLLKLDLDHDTTCRLSNSSDGIVDISFKS